ncbi:signal peptidase I [Metabacillus idriensis]|uniref:signal peptidase I n=1 Tax=Metabacillus idriensis TaxID=324768 RepID=UPI0029670D26|nr:signal peptidase I [Metabacillus idriensis]
MKEKKKQSELFEWIKAIFIAVSIALLIRGFLFAPIVVDGESMESTLNDEDRMIVSKIGKPERFDIIVFHATENKDYIKRVIGLPGDHIMYQNDMLYINGKAFEENYLDQNKKEFKEIFGENELFTENFNLENLGHKTVPKDTLFVLGDNRRYSKDSRHINVIPIDKVVGKAQFVYWPLDK